MTSYETLLNDPSTSTGAREAIRELIEAEEIQRMQLAGVMTATIQNTEETVKDRIQRGHPYWSQAYADVCAAVDREMALRTRCLQLERWKTEALTVESWWQKIDEAVRKHPSTRLGDSVAAVALRLIAERDAAETRWHKATLGQTGKEVIDEWLKKGAGIADPALGVLQGIITIRLESAKVENMKLREVLIKCFRHMGSEIAQKTLNQSAQDGAQSLSREIATLLDASTDFPAIPPG